MTQGITIGRHELRPGYPTVIGCVNGPMTRAQLREAHGNGMDVAEFRLDLFRKDPAAAVAEMSISNEELPILATIRSSRERGGFNGNEEERLALFQHALTWAGAVDVELNAPIMPRVVRAAVALHRPVILSHHNFEETPSRESLNAMMVRAGSLFAPNDTFAFKIATQIRNRGDLLTLTDLLVRFPNANLIVIGMGDAGKKTRVFFPALGSLATYAPLGESVAPGQIPFDELMADLRRHYPERR